MAEPLARFARFADGRTVCYFDRDAAGFCNLANRCWSGKPCPKTEAQAARYRAHLVDEIASARRPARAL
jgi:hypothetical protein